MKFACFLKGTLSMVFLSLCITEASFSEPAPSLLASLKMSVLVADKLFDSRSNINVVDKSAMLTKSLSEF